MKWILRILGVVVAIALLVVAIGALLPKQHVVSRQATYHQPPEAIWQTIMDYEKFPTWIKGVARVEPFQSLNGYPGWTEIESNGMKIPLQVTEAVPPRRAHSRSQFALGRHVDHRNHFRARRFRDAHHGRRLRQQPALPFHGPLRFRLRQHARFLHEIVG